MVNVELPREQTVHLTWELRIRKQRLAWESRSQDGREQFTWGAANQKAEIRVRVQVTRWPRAVHVGTACERQAANQATNETQAANETLSANEDAVCEQYTAESGSSGN